MKNTLLVILLTCTGVVAGADEPIENDYYVAIAISEYGMFEAGKEYNYAFGWHARSMLDANQQAQTRCEIEASGAGTRCISSSSLLGGCVSIARGNLVIEPEDERIPTNWSHLFVASSSHGRSEAEEAAKESCAGATDGDTEYDIKSWNCETLFTYCASDVDETRPSASELALEPLCDDKSAPEDGGCWTKLLDVEDCYVWSTFNNNELFAAVKVGRVRSCPGKVLNGRYEVSFTYVDTDDEMRTETFEGPWKNGKMSGGSWIDENTPYDDAYFFGYRNDEGQKIGEWTGRSEGGGARWTIQYRKGEIYKVTNDD